jgi:hydroxyacylglutathione hydrolase
MVNLVALPAFNDNYIWMLHDGLKAVVVDPGDAAPVIEALHAHRLSLCGILVTHHHADHIGGLAALRPLLEGCVWAPAHEDIPEPCEPLDEGDRVELLGLSFRVIDVPGHTAGHIAYYAEPEGEAPLLFCGDTLFSGGCGRLFEGTAAQMNDSLHKLASLPGDTRVCCAHEYTLANLRFAAAVEPDNDALARYIDTCQQLRAQGRPTLPSSMAVECRVNPFLRCDQAAPIAAALRHGASDESAPAVFAALREWKNHFR